MKPPPRPPPVNPSNVCYERYIEREIDHREKWRQIKMIKSSSAIHHPHHCCGEKWVSVRWPASRSFALSAWQFRSAMYSWEINRESRMKRFKNKRQTFHFNILNKHGFYGLILFLSILLRFILLCPFAVR